MKEERVPFGRRSLFSGLAGSALLSLSVSVGCSSQSVTPLGGKGTPNAASGGTGGTPTTVSGDGTTPTAGMSPPL